MRMTDHRMLSGIVLVCLNALTGIALPPLVVAQTTAPNEWTWIGGSNTVTDPYGQAGVYGTLGTPAAGNIPGARDSAATWTDSNGNFWLFGGEGVDANGNYGELNDLWEFQPSTQEWTWVGGSSALPAACAGSATVACGQPGVYGTLGSAATSNIPGGRYLTSYGTDSNGNFWLFAGAGFDSNQKGGDLNDLWEFNPTTKEWTWMGGSSTIGSSGGQPGIYGTLGSAAAANIPGSRDSAASWSDKSGQLWIYGGEGLDSQGDFGQLDDLWMFDPNTEQWTWMGGGNTLPAKCANNSLNNLCGWPAVYGALGMFSPGISPGSRVAALGWRDNDGNLWLFGGIGSGYWESEDFSEIDQYDLWEFNPSSNEWAWMSGNSTSICGESSSENWCGESGIYGTAGTPAIANIPASRSNGTTWTDANGNLWLFGGLQSSTTNIEGGSYCNDMWVFEPAANEWAWMNGDSSQDIFACEYVYGTYGVKGKAAAANTPSGRLGMAGWIDSSGNLWAFGGVGWANGGAAVVDLNDLWIYKPAAPAPQPSFELVASPNPINIGATGPGTPTITTGTTLVSILVAGGFDSPVTLSAAPDTCNGVTCITGSFSPATITGAGSSTLTISVTGGAIGIDEPIPLTVTGTSGGIAQSIQVIVDVTGAGQLNNPTFSVPTGTYATPQTVSMSDAEGIAFIYYTTDGTTPSPSSAVYVSPITITTTTTLKAFAMDVFNDQSGVSSATYTIVAAAAAAPAFAPGGGTYSSAQSVTVSDSTSGATIYYTTDGSAPTTNSTVYSGPIAVSSTETLEAIASASGYALSAVASASYTIDLPGSSFSITGTAVSVVQGATTGNISTITLTPSGGFTGVINLSCAITPTAASDPATCSIPASITISGSTAQTTTLTVNTTAPTSALNRDRRFFGPLAGGTALACILLVGIPVQRRKWWCILGMLVLFSVLGGALGCGGGSGNGGGGNSGTTPGTYSVTVTGTSGNITRAGTVALTVQ